MKRVQSEDGTLCPASIICLSECLILRLRKWWNSGRPEGSVRDSPSGYSLYSLQPVDFLFLIFNHSLGPEGRQKESVNGGQDGERWVNGYVSSRARPDCR